MKNIKRNAVIVAVLLFVCAAVYLNWSYNNNWGDTEADAAEAPIDSEAAILGREDGDAEANAESGPVSEYFAMARLTRQQSRDEALELLQLAVGSDSASSETIESAMSSITAMAECSMREAQIENLLLAKDFAECVVFIGDEGVTVVVPAPLEGLSDAAVARITDTITSESEFTAAQIRVIEVKGEASGDAGVPSAEDAEAPSAEEAVENIEYLDDGLE